MKNREQSSPTWVLSRTPQTVKAVARMEIFSVSRRGRHGGGRTAAAGRRRKTGFRFRRRRKCQANERARGVLRGETNKMICLWKMEGLFIHSFPMFFQNVEGKRGL